MSKSKSPIATLPNEGLAAILKQAADSDLPATSWEKAPAPVPASQVSSRWREVSFTYPYLWTNIRISDASQSQRLANLFIQRSGACVLDISIDLKSYWAPDCITLDTVLHIVAPHVGRWRTIVLRGLERDTGNLSEFLDTSPIPPSRLTYARFLSIDTTGQLIPGQSLPRMFTGDALGTLRLNSCWDLTSLKSLRSLHFRIPQYIAPSAIRQMFSSMIHVTTLVLREFSLVPTMPALQAHTIRSMSISFTEYWKDDSTLENFTAMFSVPNLEYLELIQAFPPLVSEISSGFRLLPPWEKSQFPHLHTLRVQRTTLTPHRLAVLQVLSREISELELIDITNFNHLAKLYRRTAVQVNGGVEYRLRSVEFLDDVADIPWPSLRSLTVDTTDITTWISRFVTLRAGLGPDTAIDRLTIRPNPRSNAPFVAHIGNTEICRRPIRPSFIDCSPPGFFVQDIFMRDTDFQSYSRSASRKLNVPVIYWVRNFASTMISILLTISVCPCSLGRLRLSHRSTELMLAQSSLQSEIGNSPDPRVTTDFRQALIF
ncbi:hypothetical protein B0H11DRAFT_1920311 [Mycena galericulata]|nr:hypothetical protein B0H11DRAFT_1920311 [Mycena galericulata]